MERIERHGRTFASGAELRRFEHEKGLHISKRRKLAFALRREATKQLWISSREPGYGLAVGPWMDMAERLMAEFPLGVQADSTETDDEENV